MRDTFISDQEYEEKYNISSGSGWHLNKARQQIRTNSNWQEYIIKCVYRPFDWRFCYFSETIVDRPRPELQQHMTRPNFSLNITRQTKGALWQHALAGNAPTPAVYVEIKDGSSVFPLYLYPNPKQKTLLDTEEPSTAPGGRRPKSVVSICCRAIGEVGDCALCQMAGAICIADVWAGECVRLYVRGLPRPDLSRPLCRVPQD